MKLSHLYRSSCRVPKNEPIPFKERLPLALKDRVSGKGVRGSVEGCVYEMSLMMTCLAENEYQEVACHKQINNFQNCYDNYLKVKHDRKRHLEKAEISAGSADFTHKQLNNFLRKFKTK